MGVLSFLKRKMAGDNASPGSVDRSLDNVQEARTRARQRLIGALVLLSIGVIGFPLLFETQPRPIPVDIPIDIPAKESAAPLVMPGPRASAVAARRAEPVPEVITETRAEAGRELPAPAASTAAKPEPAAVAVDAPADKPIDKAVDKPAPKPAMPAARQAPADAARAQALLEGKAPAASASPAGELRFIVQVGAFADPVAARDTRLKVEKLGLKTYTQVAETPAGKRIRVRVGPFANRAEADRAMARVRAAGVAAAVLTL